jgi:hypothetical protein
LNERELAAIAPNLISDMYMLRPTQFFANPPLCTLHELRTVYTLDDLANFHEVLDVREATAERWERDRQRELDRQRQTRRRR